MKKLLVFLTALSLCVYSETLFEVKDSSNNKVLEVSSDGLRVMNMGDTMMVISPSGVNVNIDPSRKGLSRTFSVTTTSSKKGGLVKALDIGTGYATMSGDSGKYTNFTPQNIFIGLNTGLLTVPNYTNGEGLNNVFIGNSCGVHNDIGWNNIFIGYKTGYSTINTRDNIFIGNYAGYRTESDEYSIYGNENVFIGTRTGYGNVDGFANVYIGTMAGEVNDGGSSNVFVGEYSGKVNSTSRNTFVGGLSFYKNTSGNQNTGLGESVGYNNLTGSGNVFLGFSSGYNELGSNRLYIENSDSSTPLIYGEFDNNKVKVNGNLSAEEITTTNDTPAVYGKHAVTEGWGIGVKGEGKYIGVYGIVNTLSDYGYGLYGYATGAGTGNRYGVYASANGGAAAWAGYFSGNVYVSGTVTANAYTEFKSDHPTDPENKYLNLSSVASSEMTNILNGNVKLDQEGKATVKLPDWFEAANTDFKYQLTAIGAPGPNLYVSKEISGNTFEIAGGVSGMKVSWMVSAVRNDNYAKANPIKNVTDKNSEDKGYYLHPEAYGLSQEKGIEYQIRNKQESDMKR